MSVLFFSGINLAGCRHVYAFNPPRFFPLRDFSDTSGARRAFAWGNDSPQARNLARAILNTLLPDCHSAVELMADDFTDDVIAKLPPSFSLPAAAVFDWVCTRPAWGVDLAETPTL